MPQNKLESLALPHESYQLAYTPDLLTDIYADKVDSSLMLEGKFTQLGGDGNWWIRSGTTQYIEASENTLDALNRFFLPIAFIDPYDAKTRVKYYSNYFLFIEETEDALGNKKKVDRFNFRTLAPAKMQDPNKNLLEVIVDELGFVKALAVSGKGDEADDLNGFNEFATNRQKTA